MKPLADPAPSPVPAPLADGHRDRRAGLPYLRSFALYLAVGVLSATTDFAVYNSLLWGVGAGALIANAISRPIGGLVCFFCNKYWTFENRGRKSSSTQFVTFWCVFGMSLVLSEVLIGLFHEVIGFGPNPAKLLAEGFIVVFNYCCLRFWTFR